MAVIRVPAFSYTFDTSIGAGVENPYSVLSAWTANGSGIINPSVADAGIGMRRNTGVYANNQYSRATIANVSPTTGELVVVSVGVRNSTAAGPTTSLYRGGCVSVNPFGITHKYEIIEVTSLEGDSETVLATAGTAGNLPNNSVIVIEAEGSDLRFYTDEGAGETLRVSTSDSTLLSGVMSLDAYINDAAETTDLGVTAWDGGSLFTVFGDFALCVGPYTSGTGNITPLIPTIETDAADYYPLLLAHSAGGENINLGTANGFSELANSPSATGAGTAGVKVAAFGNTSGAGGSAPVITDPGNHCGGLILLVGHPDGLPVVDATINNQKASASTSFSIDGVTTTVADALCIPISGRDNDSAAAAYSGWTNANLTGLAEIFDAGTTSGNGGGLGIAAGIKATAGDIGNTTGTVTSSINANYCISFKPASTGVTGAGAVTLGGVEVAGTGALVRNAAGAITLGGVEVDGTGTLSRFAAGAITLGSVEVDGVAHLARFADGEIVLGGVEVAGTADTSNTVNAAGAVTLGAVEVAGAGGSAREATAAITLGAVEVAGAGGSAREATAAITLGAVEVAATGLLSRFANGEIVLGGVEVAGAGGVTGQTVANGAVTLGAVEVAGAGALHRIAAGAITLGAVQVSGFNVPIGVTYQYKDGTGYDAQGRMVTGFVAPGDPAPGDVRYIMGLAHGPDGKRYVTSWPGAVRHIEGFAVRVDGVQVIATSGKAGANRGLPVTRRGEMVVTESPPVRSVEGVGIASPAAVSVTDAGP